MSNSFSVIVFTLLFITPLCSTADPLWDGFEKISAIKSPISGKYLACENIEAKIVFNNLCLITGETNKPAGTAKEFTLQELADNYFNQKYNKQVVAVGVLPIYYGSDNPIEDIDHIVIAYRDPSLHK